MSDLDDLALKLAKWSGEVAAIADHARNGVDQVRLAKARKLAAQWLAYGGRETRADALRWVIDRLPAAIEGVLR